MRFMKILILLITISSSLSGSLDEKKAKNSLTESNLKGKVSSVDLSMYKAVLDLQL